MQPRHVAANDVIFRAGDPSVAVYVITEGEIAITLDDGFEVVRLHAGDLFGESGVLERRPRAATATAVTQAVLLVTEADTFFHAFGMDNDRALTLVKLLCRRLRDTSLRAAHGDPAHGDPAHGDPAHGDPMHAAALGAAPDVASGLRLFPDHSRLSRDFGMTPIDLVHLPFQVGNRFGGEALPITSNQSCCIPARGDADLAAPHFEIMRRDGYPGIRDLGGRLGTIVNGITINRRSFVPFAALRPGDNQVTAGHVQSHYRFRINFRP